MMVESVLIFSPIGAVLLLALLSDVHANIEALTACLEHARASGATRYAFLGDLVGYGADPQDVVDTIKRHAASGAVVVKGNHEAALDSSTADMSDPAALAIEWTRTQLSEEARAWLRALPLCVRDGDLFFVHASADQPERWEYVESAAAAERSTAAAGTPWVFSGHVHDQTLYFQTLPAKMGTFRPFPGSIVPVPRHRRWLAIVGSAGQPRDRSPNAAYALFDLSREAITFHRVPYNAASAASKMRAAGLIDVLSRSTR